MRRFTSKELEAFLRMVDEELEAPSTIRLIGGGAVGLAYATEHATRDLDLIGACDRELEAAVRKANEKMEAPIPVQSVGILEPPYSYEERMTPLRLEGLKKLTVLVPEPHDLVLMKTARGDSHDLDAIEDIHRSVKLDLGTLIERFHETKGQVMGPPDRFLGSFLAMIERLFGTAVAKRVEQQLKG